MIEKFGETFYSVDDGKSAWNEIKESKRKDSLRLVIKDRLKRKEKGSRRHNTLFVSWCLYVKNLKGSPKFYDREVDTWNFSDRKIFSLIKVIKFHCSCWAWVKAFNVKKHDPFTLCKHVGTSSRMVFLKRSCMKAERLNECSKCSKCVNLHAFIITNLSTRQKKNFRWMQKIILISISWKV